MGSSASKASRVAGSAARKYPNRPPTTSAPNATSTSQAAPTATPNATTSTPPPTSNAPPQQPPAQASQPGPTVKPAPYASSGRDESINLDASDPDFAQSLRSIGPVQPNPALAPTSAFNSSQSARPTAPDPRQNPAVLVLDARARLQGQAEIEFMEAGKRGHEGREFLDVYTIRQILQLRDGHGQSADRIEQKLGLKKGVVERLGAKGVVGLTTDTGRAEQEIRMV